MNDDRQRNREAIWRIVAITALIAVPLVFVDWRFLSQLNFAVVWRYRVTLLSGLGVTVLYTLGGVAAGCVLGVCLALLGRSRFLVMRICVIGYVEVWRNTPLLVQLFWIQFALPMMTGVALTINQSGFIALSANIGAYYCEIVRAGISAVPRGQWEASRALGLRSPHIWTFVVFPQMFRILIPPSTNIILSALKATSVLSILGIGELMRQTTRLSDYTFRPVEFYTSAAILYVAVGLFIAALSRRLERRLDQGAVRLGI